MIDSEGSEMADASRDERGQESRQGLRILSSGELADQIKRLKCFWVVLSVDHRRAGSQSRESRGLEEESRFLFRAAGYLNF